MRVKQGNYETHSGLFIIDNGHIDDYPWGPGCSHTTDKTDSIAHRGSVYLCPDLYRPHRDKPQSGNEIY